MEDLCTACLCAGRKLFFIGETGSYHLYAQILNEIPVYELSVCVRVCWECRERLRRFREFKTLVKSSYSLLLQQIQQNPAPSSLSRPPRLTAQHLPACGYPVDAVKEEPEDFPEDCQESHEDVKPLKEEHPHSEPEAEAFVDDVLMRSRKKKMKNIQDLETSLDVEFLKAEQEAPLITLDDDAVEDLDVKKARKKKTTKKTNKEKKKVKSKSKKLEEKKINTKKKAEVASECSDDSRSFFDNDNIDGAESLDDIDDNMFLVDMKEMKDNLVTKSKKTDSKVNKISKKGKKKIGVEGEEEEFVAPPAKPNGTLQEQKREKEIEPEMLGGKPKCGECGKIFSSKKTYRYHLNVLHKGQNCYPCPRCGKVYQWKSNLGRHMRTHKARDSGELYCDMCDKSFASVATYRQHLRVSRRHVAEAEFNFSCQQCGKKFVTKTRLRDHVDWDHLHKIKFKCTLCNKPFKCHTSLYVHMQNVHRNKKKENLCHICGKSYQNAAKLKYHIVAMHTSETPYQCAQCAAAFGWYSSLYRHVREVHYKMKLQPKKIRRLKRGEVLPLPPAEATPHSLPAAPTLLSQLAHKSVPYTPQSTDPREG